jgi:hypothetical protein
VTEGGENACGLEACRAGADYCDITHVGPLVFAPPRFPCALQANPK